MYLVTKINNSEESGLEGIQKPWVAAKQATRNIIIQYSTIKQIHSRQPELALKILVIYSDQPDSALKYAVVRLVIRKGQTLKIQPLFFFKLKNKITQRISLNESDTKFLRSATLVPESKMPITKFSLLESYTLHILQPTSYHLLVQVPSCATRERKPGLGEG